MQRSSKPRYAPRQRVICGMPQPDNAKEHAPLYPPHKRIQQAQEASWREDNRKVSNGDQVKRLAGLSMSKKESPDFTGYWQRHLSTNKTA
jgi:hypothetical protein